MDLFRLPAADKVKVADLFVHVGEVVAADLAEASPGPVVRLLHDLLAKLHLFHSSTVLRAGGDTDGPTEGRDRLPQ